jgi:hypothetical protein
VVRDGCILTRLAQALTTPSARPSSASQVSLTNFAILATLAGLNQPPLNCGRTCGMYDWNSIDSSSTGTTLTTPS